MSKFSFWHNNNGGGKEVAHKRSNIVDVLFRELYDTIRRRCKASMEGLVAVALGGYARREMNPFSDVDIMFIHQDKNPLPAKEEVIRHTLTTLWDLGFKVGHSVRSTAQAINQANADMLIKTSMLECRFLIGDREVFHAFKNQFEKQCVDGREVEYLAWRMANLKKLHIKFGKSVYMQEPNVKSGCGGLRDYHNLLWCCYFKERISGTSKLVEKHILRKSEHRMLEKGYDFLLRVRTELHYLNGRPQDNLTLQLQGQVATNFHYPQKNILRRCEAFMRDYYQHARNIHLTTQTVLARIKLASENRETHFTRKNIHLSDGLMVREGLILSGIPNNL